MDKLMDGWTDPPIVTLITVVAQRVRHQYPCPTLMFHNAMVEGLKWALSHFSFCTFTWLFLRCIFKCNSSQNHPGPWGNLGEFYPSTTLMSHGKLCTESREKIDMNKDTHCGVQVIPGSTSEIGINDCTCMLSLTSWFVICQKSNHVTSVFLDNYNFSHQNSFKTGYI